MKIGIFIPQHWFQWFGPERTGADHYREAVEQAVAAERAGFDTVWVPEHQFVKFLAAPAPLPLLVKIAAKTSRIRVGTACLVLPYHHPLKLASEVAAVDALVDGRLELGLGRGSWENEFATFGQTLAESRARFQEAVDVMLGAWSQDDFAFEGTYTSFPPSTLPFRPYQQPHPPIWITAQQRESIDWSVRRGFSVLCTPNREEFATVEQRYHWFKESVERAGLSDRQPSLKIGFSRMAFIAETEEKARREIPLVLENHRLKAHLHDNCCPVKGGFGGTGPVAGEPSLDEVAENLILGGPDKVLERVARYERLGIDELILYISFGSEHSRVIESIEMFGEILPQLRGKREAPLAAGAGVA